MKLTDEKFTKKSEVQEQPSMSRAQIRAAMHEAVAYEQAFDVMAQAIRCNCENTACGHLAGQCPAPAGQAKAIHVGSLCQQCSDLMPKEYLLPPLGTARQSQVGGPNMLMDAPDNSGSDAPMADPTQVTDISDVWPEADIMKQTQDLRNQGMPDQQIFKQLVDMGVLGTPNPMQQDMAYLDQVMKSAQLGTGPAGTAASPMDGQRDTLSKEEIPGTGKIEAGPAMPPPRQMVIDDQSKRMKDLQQPKLPSMQQHQDRAQEFADFMPPSTFGQQQQRPRGAQVAPPAKPPSAPPAGPPAPGAPPAGGPPGAPPAAPGPDMDMDEEGDMPIDDMRSLTEVMEDLSNDIEVLEQKVMDGETILDGQEVEPEHDDTGAMPGGPPKIAVDQPAKDYYEGYFGEYGKQLSEDRHAAIVDIVDEVADKYKAKLTTLGIDRIATFVAARPRFDAEEGNVKFAALNDTLLVNYLFKGGMAIPDVSLAPSAFKMALHDSGQGAKVLKFAEGKMKQPKIEGKPSDWVKQDKLKDNAKDKGLELRRPAHLPMKVIETQKSGVYTQLLIEWDPDADAAKRSDKGMEQAVISYVKGLESIKEFKDLGFLGQITVDELDIEAGQAQVHFRTMKPADAPTVVKEEK